MSVPTKEALQKSLPAHTNSQKDTRVMTVDEDFALCRTGATLLMILWGGTGEGYSFGGLGFVEVGAGFNTSTKARLIPYGILCQSV